jgi:peptidyl-tRNA hydrolase
MSSLDIHEEKPQDEQPDRLKLYCVFAMESVAKMNGIRGKLGTQAGHAYVHAFWDSADRFPEEAQVYRDSQMAFKITLVVPTVEDLQKLHEHYHDVCGVSLVTDAGRTVFKNEDGSPCPTTTCLGIGPLRDSLKGEDLVGLRPLT